MADHLTQPDAPTEPRPGAGGFRPVLVALTSGLLVVAGLLLGCDETKHYRTLSFFFDGVPLPEHLRPQPVQTPAELAAQDAQTAAAALETFYHTPYAKRQCRTCHSQTTGFTLSATDGKTCRACHDDYRKPEQGDWMHGPVAQDQCGLCHHPHKSNHEGVLLANQTQLCFQCHDEPRLRQDPFHAQQLEAQTKCSTCHDPHGAGNRLLLADGRTYGRRFRAVADIRTTAHNDWSRDTCAGCHDLGASNKLLDTAGANCLTCHSEITQTPAEGQLHQAVADGKCLSCHNAHRSTRPHLLRTNAQDMCLSCHQPEKLPEQPHRGMVRVDCLVCHEGHHTSDPALLRPLLAQRFAQERQPAQPGAPLLRAHPQLLPPPPREDLP